MIGFPLQFQIKRNCQLEYIGSGVPAWDNVPLSLGWYSMFFFSLGYKDEKNAHFNSFYNHYSFKISIKQSVEETKTKYLLATFISGARSITGSRVSHK